jgi:hypothetical protein
MTFVQLRFLLQAYPGRAAVAGIEDMPVEGTRALERRCVAHVWR